MAGAEERELARVTEPLKCDKRRQGVPMCTKCALLSIHSSAWANYCVPETPYAAHQGAAEAYKTGRA